MLTLSTCVRSFAYRQRVTAQRMGCRVLCHQQGRSALSTAVAQLLLTSPAPSPCRRGGTCARGQRWAKGPRSKMPMSLKCCRKDRFQMAGVCQLGQCLSCQTSTGRYWPAASMGQRPQEARGVSAVEAVAGQHCHHTGRVQGVSHRARIVSEVLSIITPNRNQP